jgi:CheY-like chemotaxis protein
MYNIVLIDDKVNNNTSLELFIESYLDENDINLNDVKIVSFENPMDGIKRVLSSKDTDLIFLDLMMPKIHGMDVLDIIRLSNIQKQPCVVIVTALHDQEVRLEARRKKANAYITKPINIKMVRAMLDFYLKPHFESLSTQSDDEFDDFIDFDDEFEDDMEIAEEKKQSIGNLNQTHIKMSAKDFVEDVENLQYIVEDFHEMEQDLLRTIDNLSGETIEQNIPVVLESINHYASILNGFVDFYELSISLRTLDNVLAEADFGEKMLFSDKEKIALFLKALLNDLVEWQNHVFIYQDAVDVFYINASVYSSCVQLESMIKKAYDMV